MKRKIPFHVITEPCSECPVACIQLGTRKIQNRFIGKLIHLHVVNWQLALSRSQDSHTYLSHYIYKWAFINLSPSLRHSDFPCAPFRPIIILIQIIYYGFCILVWWSGAHKPTYEKGHSIVSPFFTPFTTPNCEL